MRQDEKEPSAGAGTLQAIADRCGVTKTTVSYALRQHPRVKEGTRKRILAVAAELGYDPNHTTAARHMALRRHGQEIIYRNIAVLIHPNDLRLPYFVSLLEGVATEITHHHYTLLLWLSATPDAAANAVPSTFTRGDIDGVISVSTTGQWPIRALLEQHPVLKQVPLVTIIDSGSQGYSSVLFDEHLGGYLAAQHLLELGHRHLAIHEGYGSHFYLRQAGMLQAFTERKLPPDHLHVIPFAIANDWWDPHHLTRDAAPDAAFQHTEQTFLAYLIQHPEITGLLARNDADAIQMIRALRRAGCRVPEDISVVGFDDTYPLVDADGVNTLTTLRAPLAQAGYEAVNLIIRQVESQRAFPTNIVLPVTLMPRATTAPPR